MRLDAVAPRSQRQSFHPPFMRGLGELLLYLTNWTDDQSGVLGDSCHGKWAGHRFDITVLDDISNEADGSWIDGSEHYSWIAERVE